MHVPIEIVAAVAKSRDNRHLDLTSFALATNTLKLAWLPQWHAQDSWLIGGSWNSYHLEARGSTELETALQLSGFHGIFSSGASYSNQALELTGRIDKIIHPKLGELRSLTWTNGMFLVTRTDGSYFILDDEDGAGYCDIPNIAPSDWNLYVEMTIDLDYAKKLHASRPKV